MTLNFFYPFEPKIAEIKDAHRWRCGSSTPAFFFIPENYNHLFSCIFKRDNVSLHIVIGKEISLAKIFLLTYVNTLLCR